MTDMNKNASGGEPEAQLNEQHEAGTKMLDLSIALNGADKKGKIRSIGELPSVRAYLQRVGAEVSSMFRAKVWDRSGEYPKALAKIDFGRDGTVKVGVWSVERADVEPTEAEAAAIAAEVLAAPFVEPVLPYRLSELTKAMAEAQAQDTGRGWPKYLFEFRDPSGKQILMVQTRKDLEGGKKNYCEWTHWEEIGWELQQPDELPLWGLDQLKDKSAVFIHEGAGGAAHCRWMTEGETHEARAAQAAHPWGGQLICAAHVGWVGGALSPLSTDWGALAKAGVQQAFIVTDNDQPGRDAVVPIARALAKAGVQDVHWVQFDDKFPEKFDLADKFPPDKADVKMPKLWECTFPATWATHKLPSALPQGRGRPPAAQYALRSAFSRQWAVVAEEGRSLFVHRSDTRRKYSEETFNDRVRPFSDVRNTADLLKQDPSCSFSGIAYRPGLKAVELNEGGRRLINVWSGARLEGNPMGDRGLWISYLAHLFPDAGERYEVCRWLATLIARPSVRMRYGLLLFSRKQGTGKSTLLAVLQRLLGEWNCSTPAEYDIVDSVYTDWIAEKVLVFVHEIYAGNSWKAYRKLKGMTADDTVLVSKKYVPAYQVESRAHFILCSNQSTGVTIENDDRRFLVPRVTEELRPKEDWVAFYDWLNGDGPAVINRWAHEFVAEHGAVGTADRAPMTERKRKLIEDSRSPAHRMLIDLAEAARARAAETGAFVALVDADVAAWLKAVVPEAKMPLHVMREVLVEGGMFETVRLQIGGHKRICCVTSETAVGVGATEARQNSVQPSDLLEGDM
jgi:hypothetical protein